MGRKKCNGEVFFPPSLFLILHQSFNKLINESPFSFPPFFPEQLGRLLELRALGEQLFLLNSCSQPRQRQQLLGGVGGGSEEGRGHHHGDRWVLRQRRRPIRRHCRQQRAQPAGAGVPGQHAAPAPEESIFEMRLAAVPITRPNILRVH